MPKIISTILRKTFWIFKGEIMLVCLPAMPLHALVLLTGFNQPFCPQVNICPYLQERATKSFIL